MFCPGAQRAGGAARHWPVQEPRPGQSGRRRAIQTLVARRRLWRCARLRSSRSAAGPSLHSAVRPGHSAGTGTPGLRGAQLLPAAGRSLACLRGAERYRPPLQARAWLRRVRESRCERGAGRSLRAVGGQGRRSRRGRRPDRSWRQRSLLWSYSLRVGVRDFTLLWQGWGRYGPHPILSYPLPQVSSWAENLPS